MTVYIRTSGSMDSTIYYNVDCKKLRQLKAQYKRAGWKVTDKGEQGNVFTYRLIQLD